VTPDAEVATLVALVNHLLKRCSGHEEFPDGGRLVEDVDMVAFVCVDNFMRIRSEKDDGTECTPPFSRSTIVVHQTVPSGLYLARDLGDRVAIVTKLDALEPPEPMDVLVQEVPDTTSITSVEFLTCFWVGTRPFPHLYDVAGEYLGHLASVGTYVFEVYLARGTGAGMTRVTLNICLVTVGTGRHSYKYMNNIMHEC